MVAILCDKLENKTGCFRRKICAMKALLKQLQNRSTRPETCSLLLHMPKLSLHFHKMRVRDPIHEFHYSLSSQEYIPHKFRGMGVGIQAFRSGKEHTSITCSHAGWCESHT